MERHVVENAEAGPSEPGGHVPDRLTSDSDDGDVVYMGQSLLPREIVAGPSRLHGDGDVMGGAADIAADVIEVGSSSEAEKESGDGGDDETDDGDEGGTDLVGVVEEGEVDEGEEEERSEGEEASQHEVAVSTSFVLETYKLSFPRLWQRVRVLLAGFQRQQPDFVLPRLPT